MNLIRISWRLLIAIVLFLSSSVTICHAMSCKQRGSTPSYITSITPNVWYAGGTYNVVITGYFDGNTPPTPGCAFDEIGVYYWSSINTYNLDGFYLYGQYPFGSGDVTYTGTQYLTSSADSYVNNGTDQIGFTVTVAQNAPSGTVFIGAGCDGGCSGAEGTVQIGSTKNVGDPCDIPGCDGVGDPINVSSGNVFEEVTDYKTAGQNKLSYVRYYNSLPVSTYFTELGSNWRSNYDRYLQLISNDIITAERPDGQQLTFYYNGVSWTCDSDVDYTLTQSGSNWTLTDHDDTVEVYDGIYGLLQSVTLRNGYAQTMTYNPINQLTTVKDSYNRQLTFTYSGGTVDTVTTPDGLVLTYGYNSVSNTNDQLASVSYSGNSATQQYLYENVNLPYALTSIKDENGTTYKTWTYDSVGRGLTSQMGGGANLTTVTYDDTHNTRMVTNALGVTDTYTLAYLQNDWKITNVSRAATGTTAAATETFSYDSNGFLSSQTDWNGNQTTYVNDIHGDPTTINEAFGSSVARTTTIAYDSTLIHLPDTITTPGLTTTFTYDSGGNVLTKTLTDTANNSTRVWQYTWQNSLLATVQSPRTDLVEKTTYTYDSTGALTGITNPLNQQTNITSHTGGGLPLTIADPNGVTTNLTYDSRQHLLTSTTAGHTTSYGYDAAENLTSVTQPDGSSLSYTYDTAHRLTAITDLLGQRISYTLDALGDRTATNIQNESQHSNTFDALGRMLTDVGAANQTASFTYDAMGNMVTATDQASHETQRSFDALNRLYQVLDPANGTTITSYDAHDRPLTVTSPNGVLTTYTYDGFSDLLQENNSNTGTTAYSYDGAGNRITRIAATGATTQYTYDALDRVLTEVFPSDSAENVTYTYDQTNHGAGIGRLTSVSDAAGTLSRSYDQLGNLLDDARTTSAATLTTAYTYDPASRIASITYPSGTAVRYTRDTMGRITGITAQPNGGASASVVSNISYEPFGPYKELTNGNGVVEARSFDQDYRLTGIIDNGASATLQGLAYTYFSTNNVQTVTNAVASSSAFGSTTTSYGYGTGSDQLATLSVGGVQTQSIGYTADGRIASLNPGIQAPAGQYITSLSYNRDGRLSAVNAAGGTLANYTYDGFGQRLKKTVSGSYGEIYQYSQDGMLLEETNASGVAQADYLYLDGRPVAVLNGSTIYYLHDDMLGTPQLATDSNQAVQWQASYDAFGQASVSGTVTQNLRLPGQYFDVESGWNHNGFRDYMPALGRYAEPDPIALASGSTNLYTYALDNPIRFTDPFGKDVWLEGPNGNEPTGHLSINVGDPNGTYYSYSFGVNGDPWLGGEVYNDTSHGGEILPDYYLHTTADEDARVKGILDAQLGKKAPYRPWRTCRNFSQNQFNEIKDQGIGKAGPPPPRSPAPGSKPWTVPSTTSTLAWDWLNLKNILSSSSTSSHSSSH